MKKIVFFTGAGVSQESGIDTFRDKGGMWENFSIDEVATVNGWRKNREKVLDFYNGRRKELSYVNPNAAHEAISALEGLFDVKVITQNVDDLHERAGSKDVIHLHGQLLRATSSNNPNLSIPWTSDITTSDKHPKDGSQLRPCVVWFGEYPYDVLKANECILEADYLIIVGTSLSIGYITPLLCSAPDTTKIIYIDPNPSEELSILGKKVIYLREKASIGVPEIIKQIKENTL
jgi:NAD-dependent deacetylase